MALGGPGVEPREDSQATPPDRAVRHIALIPAAGSGTRLGARIPKQYLELCGRTVIEWTVEAFLAEPWFDRVVVVVQPDDGYVDRLPGLDRPRVELIRRGGGSRRDTVLNGLTTLAQQGLADPHDWIYVHDAARPGIDSTSLRRLAVHLQTEPCGALLCIPVADTVKRVDPVASLVASDELRSGGTVDRSRLWLAQTPQVFRAGALRRALAAHPGVTDESAAMEAEGGRPRMITGSRRNMKITTLEDLIMMRVMMSRQPTGKQGS